MRPMSSLLLNFGRRAPNGFSGCGVPGLPSDIFSPHLYINLRSVAVSV